ncbi:hypothetical protein ACCQ25_08120 [Xanthomonas campestris pv. olitorii]
MKIARCTSNRRQAVLGLQTCPWQVVAASRENGSMVERSSISATRALRIRIDGVMHHADDVFEVAQHEFDPSRSAAPVGQE